LKVVFIVCLNFSSISHLGEWISVDKLRYAKNMPIQT